MDLDHAHGPVATMRPPDILDTLLWFGILALTGGATAYWWSTWWAVFPYLVRTVLYEIASFMVRTGPTRRI